MATFIELSNNIQNKFQKQVEGKKFHAAAELFRKLHPADRGKIFRELKSSQQKGFLLNLEIEEIADLFDELDDQETFSAAQVLPLPFLADVVDDMDPDEAADLLGDLSGQDVRRTISLMDEPEDVLPLLRYPDETAGGRMTTDYLVLKPDEDTHHAIEYLREMELESDVPYYLFVVENDGTLVGVTGLRELVYAPPDHLIRDIMNKHVISIEAMRDQEEAARLMIHYDLAALPVVTKKGRLIGVISHDDILDVMDDETTEDIYRLASVTDTGLEPESNIFKQFKGRLPWLLLNTITALFGSWIISNYEDLFLQVAVLAFFQSVVASQGGNAASQSVAMIVRSLALGKLEIKKVWPVLLRQLAVGMFLGVVVGLIVGTGVGLWQENPYLGLVLGLALLGNMLVASLVGTLGPLLLELLNQDPAMASSVLVTALTDSIGFLIFLSLARLFLPFIQKYV
ncbi:MAG: magnesium transporter [Anaerolineales bacterium]|nr:magnesium transporter [Anaerolineales bacterium]MBS3753764.1 magnesium transporter [Anaerolineales bacterium]